MFKVLKHLAEPTLPVFLVSVSPSPHALALPDRPSPSQAWNVQPERSVLLVPLLGDSFYSDSSISRSPSTLLVLAVQVQGGCRGLLRISYSGARSLESLICDRIFELPPVYADVEKCVPVQLVCWHTPACFKNLFILIGG